MANPSLTDSSEKHPERLTDASSLVRPVAVIDVGSTSVRMAIAEIDGAGSIRRLETLSREVNLGRDTFTVGGIRRATTEGCVAVLRSYRQLLEEYGISGTDQIRVVATSAVREAENRLSFLDRVYVATGFEIEAIDEAEVNRMTYLGIQPLLEQHPTLATAQSIVTEVGGGSTEVLLVQAGDVIFSNTYRLGSQRLRETLEADRTPQPKVTEIMRGQVRRIMEQVAREVPGQQQPEVIVLGSDVRFAASQLASDWDRSGVVSLNLEQLETFSESILEQSVNDLVRNFHLSFPDAGTVGPALLTIVELARTFQRDHLYICNVNLRDGLLRELAADDTWSDEFARQVFRSAIDLGRRCEFDEAHARHVAELSSQLFKNLQDEHHLEPRYGMLLHTAALLHEIGQFVGTASLHKHSLYLIQHSDLFGLSSTDVLLAGLVARYHRGAAPKPTHRGYAGLDREHRTAVAKLAAILRLAKALDESHSQRIQEITCLPTDGKLVMKVPGLEDVSLEQMALNHAGSLFEQIFGLPVLLRPDPSGTSVN